MKDLYIWDSKIKDKFKYESDINIILKRIKESKKSLFSVIDEKGFVNGKYNSLYMEAFAEYNSDYNIYYVDENHPFCIDMDDKILIEKNFYEKNKKVLNDFFIENLLKNDYIKITRYMYSEELIDKLLKTAKNIQFDPEIILSDEIIKKLKDNYICSYTYKDGKRINYSSDKILGFPYEKFKEIDKEIILSCDIDDFENLKLIPDNCVIKIQRLLSDDENYYDKLYKIIYQLRNYGKDNKIIVKIDDRDIYENSSLFKSDLDFNIESKDSEIYTSKEFKEESNLFELMVKNIKDSDMSPYEKFLSVYNITKKFKQYNENEENKSDSRHIKRFLNNEYMVCVGYSKLLMELCRRVGINTYNYSVSVDTSYDDGFTNNEISSKLVGHARVIVSLDDDKYNIHGFYVSDPTWDNNLEEDYYNHSLMSFDKVLDSRRYFKLSNEDLIMDIKSIDELNEKYKIYYSRNSNLSFRTFNSEKEKQNYVLGNMVHDIKRILSNLYPEEYERLLNEDADYKTYDLNNKYEQFIDRACRIFIKKRGSDIPLDTTIEAASFVNQRIYGFSQDELEEYKNILYEKNLERDKISFPYYYQDYYEKKAV